MKSYPDDALQAPYLGEKSVVESHETQSIFFYFYLDIYRSYVVKAQRLEVLIYY